MKAIMLIALLLVLGCEAVGTNKETEIQNDGRSSILESTEFSPL
jgi:hypothetical protein